MGAAPGTAPAARAGTKTVTRAHARSVIKGGCRCGGQPTGGDEPGGGEHVREGSSGRVPGGRKGRDRGAASSTLMTGAAVMMGATSGRAGGSGAARACSPSCSPAGFLAPAGHCPWPRAGLSGLFFASSHLPCALTGSRRLRRCGDDTPVNSRSSAAGRMTAQATATGGSGTSRPDAAMSSGKVGRLPW